MLLIKRGRIVDPASGRDKVGDIIIEGERIAYLGSYDHSGDLSPYDEVIDAEGMVVAPGLVDVHVHFRDPGFTYKEDISYLVPSAGRIHDPASLDQ